MKLSSVLPCALGPQLPGECTDGLAHCKPAAFMNFFILLKPHTDKFLFSPSGLPVESVFRVIMSPAIHNVTLERLFPITGTLGLMWQSHPPSVQTFDP